MTNDEELRKLAERLGTPRYGEPLMQRWDEWRLKHHQGYSGSLTRDEFESIIDGIDQERSAASSAILSLMEEKRLWELEKIGMRQQVHQILDNSLTWNETIAEAQFKAKDAEARATLAETRLERALEALREISLVQSHDDGSPNWEARIARTVLSEMERENVDG